MRKNHTTLNHTTRGLLLIVFIALISVVIFALTRPLLAPGFRAPSENNTNTVESGSSFNETSSTEINIQFGEGVRANSFLVYEERSGKIIAARNTDSPMAIASLTKLMTTWIIQEYGNMEDVWAIGASSTSDIRPVLGLIPGDRVQVSDLVKAMLVGSANDAATALGTYITSITNESMIDLMNKEADELGMDSTHYENPIGFDSEQNYSTASDLKLLLKELHPSTLFTEIDRKQFYSFISENGRSYSVRATNILLAEDSEIHAIKTGFTDEARGALITSIHLNDQKYIIIVLASPDREGDTRLLKQRLVEKPN